MNRLFVPGWPGSRAQGVQSRKGKEQKQQGELLKAILAA